MAGTPGNFAQNLAQNFALNFVQNFGCTGTYAINL